MPTARFSCLFALQATLVSRKVIKMSLMLQTVRCYLLISVCCNILASSPLDISIHGINTACDLVMVTKFTTIQTQTDTHIHTYLVFKLYLNSKYKRTKWMGRPCFWVSLMAYRYVELENTGRLSLTSSICINTRVMSSYLSDVYISLARI